ncbi:MAG: gumN, partial [Gammaproteobacteria bacterium]|nr:gumN [Gammaproteobacteria bacterium]
MSLFAGRAAMAVTIAEKPAPPLDEIVVTAERAGPGMWHVHRGDANVWILGSISPLPRDITWRSNQVENVLERTSQVLVQKPIEISIPRVLWMLIADRKFLMVGGGKRLKDVLPPELYARFDAQRSKLEEPSDKWERYRPIIAAAFLQQA